MQLISVRRPVSGPLTCRSRAEDTIRNEIGVEHNASAAPVRRLTNPVCQILLAVFGQIRPTSHSVLRPPGRVSLQDCTTRGSRLSERSRERSGGGRLDR